MKNLLTLSIFCLLLLTIVKAQTPPEAFNYTGAVRDASGNPISNKTISTELSILQNSENGTLVYRERHTVATDKFGVFNCSVGQGSVQEGTFSSISWGDASYFLKVALDIEGGTDYDVIGSTQLLSVPYAFFSKSTGSVFSGNGPVIGEPLFTEGSGVVDIDGNTYKSVIVGGKEWMSENLKVSRYRNGSTIPNVTNDNQWINLSIGAWCNYNNDTSNNSLYGKLYNWFAVSDSRNICPNGWHVPTNSEFSELITFIDPINKYRNGVFSGIAGGAMKSTGTLQKQNGLWQHPNVEATNISGFSGTPGGLRLLSGSFGNETTIGYWWTSTEFDTEDAWGRSVFFNNGTVDGGESDKNFGFSVRCVKD